MTIIVQKYGGSSVAEPQKILNVAQFIKNRLEQSTDNQQICVVVSAMGDTTNNLINLAHQVNPSPSKRELDMLLSCGERSSMALLAMALQGLGVKALSLTGSQSGIITDENHRGAELRAIRPHRVLQAFETQQVVIIAGFQGVSRAGEITTLRRGGSDTTAVAMAAALNAELCEIYTDVAGIMSMDPSINPSAELIPEINLKQVCALSLYGARVLAHDAAKIAHNLGVELLIAKSAELKPGTSIREKLISDARNNLILSITHLRGVIKLELKPEQLEACTIEYLLCASWLNNKLVGYASNDIAQELHALENSVTTTKLALVTLHTRHQQACLKIISKLVRLFATNSLEFLDIITGNEQIFVVVHDEHLHKVMSVMSILMEHKSP
jgi:aspartokinase